MIPMWRIKLEGYLQRFAAWRAAVWLRKAKRALRLHDWWRAKAGDK
jgi:hypothetical protein